MSGEALTPRRVAVLRYVVDNALTFRTDLVELGCWDDATSLILDGWLDWGDEVDLVTATRYGRTLVATLDAAFVERFGYLAPLAATTTNREDHTDA